MGIRFRGKNSLVKNNFVSNFGFIKDDGGGIYTYVGNGDQNLDTGSIVRKNIIINGIGAPTSSTDNNTYSEGIYLDDGTQGIFVDSNTIYGATFTGIYLKGAFNTIRSNVVHVNTAHATYGGFTFTSKRNVLYKATSTYPTFVATYNTALITTQSIDSNYYFLASGLPIGRSIDGYTLPDWRVYSGYDINSTTAYPSTYTSTTPILIYNPTLTDSTVVLGGNYVDVYGNIYLNRALVRPYLSKLLFPSSFTYVGRSHFKFKLRS